MTVNLFGRSSQYDQSLAKIVAAFGEGAVWAFKPTREGNTVVLALRTPVKLKRHELQERAEAVQARWPLPATRWVKVFKPVAYVSVAFTHQCGGIGEIHMREFRDSPHNPPIEIISRR